MTNNSKGTSLLHYEIYYSRKKFYYKGPGACIIKYITTLIYGFHNKLGCLSLNTRLGWKGLPGKNSLAYYGNCKLWPY